jgi:hypothetical protein
MEGKNLSKFTKFYAVVNIDLYRFFRETDEENHYSGNRSALFHLMQKYPQRFTRLRFFLHFPAGPHPGPGAEIELQSLESRPAKAQFFAGGEGQ